MKRVLLTGFEPFHNASSNPTQEIVRVIQDDKLPNVVTTVLPVEFGRAGLIACKLIDEIKPDVVIALGQAEGRAVITPEKIAINLDNARIPDNAGNMPSGTEIIPEGPDGHFSTLPVEEIVKTLQEEKLPASVSYSAGTFVCNNVFYLIQSHCKDKKIKSGFVHVPLMESQAAEFPGLPVLSIEMMLNAIKIMIAEVQRQ